MESMLFTSTHSTTFTLLTMHVRNARSVYSFTSTNLVFWLSHVVGSISDNQYYSFSLIAVALRLIVFLWPCTAFCNVCFCLCVFFLVFPSAYNLLHAPYVVLANNTCCCPERGTARRAGVQVRCVSRCPPPAARSHPLGGLQGYSK